MRIEGTERKRFNKKLDESVLEWIHEIHSTGLRVSRKLIMKKAIVIHDDMVTEGESNEDFKASTGWLNGFMRLITVWHCNEKHNWLEKTKISL